MTKRRPNGDGMIRKRTDGRWEGRIVVGHKENGKPIYKAVLAKTQKELIPKLNQLKETYTGVELTENSRMTLGEWLDKWLNEYKTPVLRSSTVHSYRNHIENHIKPHLGDKVITQVTTADVQKMYNTVKSSGRIRDGQSLSDVTTDMQKNASNIVGNFITDIFGEELKPWQSEENPAKVP